MNPTRQALRRCAAGLAAVVLAATPALAQNSPPPAAPAEDGKKTGGAPDAAEGAAAEPAKPPATARSRGIDLLRVPGDAPAARGSVDLFPKTVFDRGARTDPDRRGSEEHPGLSLGGDGGWKSHAMQAGLIVGGFAALSLLCGTGACMIPEGATSWLPEQLRAKPQVIPDPRPAPRGGRQLR